MFSEMSLLFLCCYCYLYIYLCMLQTQQYIVIIITLYNCKSFKEIDRKERQACSFDVNYNNLIYHFSFS